MDVGVGYFSNPQGLEGLAHFLEHMLSYASEKYPLEDSYSKYITEHGGRKNAATSSEHTNYHFDVNADCFDEKLDRFAQLFIKPLMSADATTREIKAVDSENKKNLLSDARRMHQLQKHLSAPDHPYHKFSTGNWDILEVQPKARGVDTRQELLKFYEQHYSANLMHLVVYGKESLDKSQSMVESKFQEIRNNDQGHPRFAGQPCSSEHVQILVKAIPIKQGHKLRFAWPMKPGIHHYKEGPSRYLRHLIGHQAEGSLFYVLKKLGWATSLSAGESDWSYEFSFFEVVIGLTDAGHEHFADIVALLFRYVNLLKDSGACKWIFDELAAICETGFHYRDKISPIDYVVNVASNMQRYVLCMSNKYHKEIAPVITLLISYVNYLQWHPPEDWLVGSSLPSNFSPEVIESALKELTPATVRIFWTSKNFEGQTDKKEPWYGTAYSVEKITPSTIQQWMERAPEEQLHLPAPNVFIPTDLSLKDVLEKKIFPVLLSKSQYSRIWYKPDTMFSIPKAYVRIDFNCPLCRSSPESEVLTDIFTRLVTDYLSDYAYNARVAGLRYRINSTDRGFRVTLIGYNHKLRLLLETVVNKIAKFEVIPDRFAVIKESVTKEYQNIKFQQPRQQAMYYCSLILQDKTWPWTDDLEVIPHLGVDDLSRFYPLMLSRAFLECYVAGNIQPIESQSMIKYIEDTFYRAPQPTSQALFPSQHLTNRIIKLERGINYIYSIEGLNPSDTNSAFIHYIQLNYRGANYLPYDSYVRKTVGYLFAIQHGAKKILDVDGRGEIIDNDVGKHFDVELAGESARQEVTLQHSHENPNRTVVNPSVHFGQRSVWPTRLPLENVGEIGHELFYTEIFGGGSSFSKGYRMGCRMWIRFSILPRSSIWCHCFTRPKGCMQFGGCM